MAGIVDYASLKTEIGNYLHRSDLGTELDTLIQGAETKLNRVLRTRKMITNSQATALTDTVPLPIDYLQLVNIELVQSPVIPLKFVSIEQRDLYDLKTNTGQPRIYTIDGSNIILAPPPDQPYTVAFTYYAKLPTLVGGVNTTNWLLTDYPDLYLKASLLEASGFIGQDPRGPYWISARQEAIDDLNKEDDDAMYAGSIPRLRPDVGW